MVADTDASVAFYRDRLGLRVTGESENHGIEQERLNAVPGAWLRITTLRAPSGPGVELVEFRSPSDGRPFPADVRSSDRVRWQTSIAIGDARAAEVRLSEACVPLVSAGLAEDPGPPGGARALVIADPDGHAILLRELAP